MLDTTQKTRKKRKQRVKPTDWTRSWRATVSVKVTAILLWGLVLVGFFGAVILLQGSRQEFIDQYTGASYKVAYNIERYLSDPVSSETRSLEAKLERERSENGFSAIRFQRPGQTIQVGTPVVEEDRVVRPFSDNADALQLTLYFPDLNELVIERRKKMILGMVVVFLLTGLSLVKVINQVISDPFKDMVETAKAITGGDWRERLDDRRNDEFGYLATFFNQMLDRLVGNQRVLRRALAKVRTSEARLENEVKERTLALEHTAAALYQREQLLTEFAQITSRNMPTQGQIRALLQLGTQLLDLDEAYLWEIREKDPQVAVHYPAHNILPEATIRNFQKALHAFMLERPQPIVFMRSSESELRRFTSKLGIEAYVGIPLFVDEHLKGSLNFFSVRPRDQAFSAENLSFVELCADWAGTKLTMERQADLISQQKERAQVTLESIGDGVITTDAGGLVEYLNPVAETLTGWNTEEASGRPLTDIFHIVDEHSRRPVEDPVKRCLAVDGIVTLDLNMKLIHRDGREFAIEDSAAPIRSRDNSVVGAVVVFHDVSNAREMANQLSYQATHDFLTGLVNRHEFERRLNRMLTTARTDRISHALFYMDLDQFKIVNDTCGHVAGDQLLKQVTALLNQHVRDSDTLARLGGDEFGYLLEGCPLEKAIEIADEVRQLVKDFRFVWKDKTFEVGVSIGLVPITELSQDMGSVMSAADSACYAAKEKGRDRVHVYEAGDADLARRHGEMQWVLRIQKALEENRMVLYWQPIVTTMQSSEIQEPLHFEILIRMRDEDGKIIDPGSFVPAAERYDLMPAIDRWVIENVCRASRAIPPQSKYADCRFSINLSGATMDDERLLDFVTETFVEYEMSPERICFEVTETAAIANLGSALRLINELRYVGCRFSLDDFGSGFSSFAYLKNLPVDYLKIDGGFIKDMTADPIDYVMVKSIQEIGSALGIKTVAEYVESRRIFEALRELGVDYAQGYWIARPEPMAFTDDSDKVKALS